jgi:hypothetical protein
MFDNAVSSTISKKQTKAAVMTIVSSPLMSTALPSLTREDELKLNSVFHDDEWRLISDQICDPSRLQKRHATLTLYERWRLTHR